MTQTVNRTSTELALMWLAHSSPETQSHRHSDGVVIQMKAQAGHRQGLHPGRCLRLCGGEEARSGHMVGPLQQTFLRCLGEDLVPGALFVFF